jgi:hypothetical protein
LTLDFDKGAAELFAALVRGHALATFKTYGLHSDLLFLDPGLSMGDALHSRNCTLGNV